MMRLIYFELRNIVFGKFFWVLLAALFLVDGYQVYQIKQQYNDEIEGHEEIYKDYRGLLTEERIQSVIDRYKELQDIVEPGTYSREGGQEGTYTGYYAAEYSEFQELYQNYKYIYEYRQYAREICDQAEENKNLNMQGGQNLRNVSEKIIQIFQGRKLDSYYEMEGSQKLVEYDFSSLLCVIITLFCASKVIFNDKKRKTFPILETSAVGMRRILMAKVIGVAFIVCICCLIFSLLDYSLFRIYFNMDGMGEPLYAIQDYAQTGFVGSVWQFWFVQGIWRCSAYIFFGVLQIIMAVFCRDELRAVLLGMAVYAGCIVLYFSGKYYFNPIGLLAGSNLVKSFEYRRVFGYIMLYPASVFAVVLIVTAILISILVWHGRINHVSAYR